MRDPLFTALVDQHLLAPSPASSQDAFKRDVKGAWSCDMDRVEWTLLVPHPCGFVRQLERLVVSSDWPDGWESYPQATCGVKYSVKSSVKNEKTRVSH